MNLKLFTAALAIFLVAFAGVVFAFPNWGKGNSNSSLQNETAAWTGHSWPGQRHSGNQSGPSANETGRGPMLWTNGTTPNATVLEQFKEAVQAGDYATAKQFYQSYGIGGRLFGSLNETTFAKYSQIYIQISDLLQNIGLKDLGVVNQPGFGPAFEGFGAGPGPRHIMRTHITHGTNTKTTTTS